MQFYCCKLNNFFRFGEDNNTVILDLLPEYKELLKEITMDELYERIMEDPLTHVKKVKESGITNLITILGENGVGKSTIFESICYVLYGKIVRQIVNTDKKGGAGYSIITEINKKYPKGIKESYAEWLFEDQGKIYLIKRGYSLTKTGNVDSPILEFTDITNGTDSRSGHRTKDTSKDIVKAIGIDFDIMTSGIMFGQNDSGKFLISGDKDRKTMLIKILHLDGVVEGCLKNVRDKKNEKGKQVEKLQIELGIVTKDMESKDSVETLRQKIVEEESAIKDLSYRIKQNNDEVERLSKTDVIKESERIKNEGLKAKEELNTKGAERDKQVGDWKRLSQEAEQLSNVKTNEISGVNDKIASLETKYANIKTQVDGFDKSKIDKDLEIVEKAKLKKPEVIAAIDKLTKEDNKVSSEIAINESNYKKTKTEIELLQKQISGVDGQFVCDKCKSVVSKEHIKSEISKNTESLNALKTTIIALRGSLETIKKQILELNGKREKVEDWIAKEGKLKGELQNFENNKVRLQELKDQAEDHKKAIERLSKEKNVAIESKKQHDNKIVEINDKFAKDIKDLTEKLEGIKEQYKKAEEIASGIKVKISILKNTTASLQNAKSSSDSKVGALKKEIENTEKNKEKILELTKTLEEENLLLKRYLTLEDVFGLEGIQTRIVNRYLPMLNQYIAEFLTILSNGNIMVDVYTKENSEIDLDIRGNSGSSYSMLSGGEKEICRLAVSTSLALLSFSRTANKPDLVCLDEIFGQLDETHKSSVFKLLKSLQHKFSRIIVISHNPEINEGIPHKILVEKSIGYTGLSMIKEII